MTTASPDQPDTNRPSRIAPSRYAAMTFTERRDAVRAEFALLDTVPPRRRPGDYRYAPSPPSTPHSPDADAAAAAAAVDTAPPGPIADVVALRPTTRRAPSAQ